MQSQHSNKSKKNNGAQSARIAGFRGNSIPLPSSGGSQRLQSNSNAMISRPIRWSGRRWHLNKSINICIVCERDMTYFHRLWHVTILSDVCFLLWDVTPLQHTPQHTATHCNTLPHTATHCNTLQHTDLLSSFVSCPHFVRCQLLFVRRHHTATHPATHCNTLQHTATHCNTLQHAATQVVTCMSMTCHTWMSHVTHGWVMSLTKSTCHK